jgi:hypothetical protein
MHWLLKARIPGCVVVQIACFDFLALIQTEQSPCHTEQGLSQTSDWIPG